MKIAALFPALLTAALLGACSKPGPLPGPTPGGDASLPAVSGGTTAAPEGMVCCESFGYGAMMAKCCEKWEWTTAEACVVPAEHVGGGKSIVPNEKCASLPPAG